MTSHETGRAAEPGCPRGCPEGGCYCAEPTFAETVSTPYAEGMCTGCGGIDECYCGEE